MPTYTWSCSFCRHEVDLRASITMCDSKPPVCGCGGDWRRKYYPPSILCKADRRAEEKFLADNGLARVSDYKDSSISDSQHQRDSHIVKWGDKPTGATKRFSDSISFGANPNDFVPTDGKGELT